MAMKGKKEMNTIKIKNKKTDKIEEYTILENNLLIYDIEEASIRSINNVVETKKIMKAKVKNPWILDVNIKDDEIIEIFFEQYFVSGDIVLTDGKKYRVLRKEAVIFYKKIETEQ